MTKIATVRLLIVNYPGAMQSAIIGLKDMFMLANQLSLKFTKYYQFQSKANSAHKSMFDTRFEVDTIDFNAWATPGVQEETAVHSKAQVIILPPSVEGEFYINPEASLIQWLVQQHQQGSIICSVCAGSFVIAATGLLDHRAATTHWDLAGMLAKQFPKVQVNSDKIIINDGDIITAGGLMSWIDLGLELVAQFSQPAIMRQLGKYLIVDTGLREQSYYQSFKPTLDHGDEIILKIQHFIQVNYQQTLSIAKLAKQCHLTERTFLRHFVTATGFKPNEYIQRLRIQKACDLLETTTFTFEMVSLKVGYEDTSACRKAFVKITSLTPKEFKRRFSHTAELKNISIAQ
jgi:transcriptional regulator GlxA family with amidase domain